MASNQILFIVGLNWTTASDAALLMPTIPVFAVAIGAATGLERVSAARVTGIALSVAGALVVLDPTRFSLGDRGVLGDGLLLANCLCYAAYLYALNTWAVRRSSPSLAASYVTSQPVIAALLAVPLLGESIGLRALVGFAAISGGLLMAAGPRRAA